MSRTHHVRDSFLSIFDQTGPDRTIPEGSLDRAPLIDFRPTKQHDMEGQSLVKGDARLHAFQTYGTSNQGRPPQRLPETPRGAIRHRSARSRPSAVLPLHGPPDRPYGPRETPPPTALFDQSGGGVSRSSHERTFASGSRARFSRITHESLRGIQMQEPRIAVRREPPSRGSKRQRRA